MADKISYVLVFGWKGWILLVGKMWWTENQIKMQVRINNLFINLFQREESLTELLDTSFPLSNDKVLIIGNERPEKGNYYQLLDMSRAMHGIQSDQLPQCCLGPIARPMLGTCSSHSEATACPRSPIIRHPHCT